MFGFFISIIVFGKQLKLFNISATYYDYVLKYWNSNLLMLFFLVLFYGLLFSNAFRGQFKMYFQYRSKPELLDPHTERVFSIVNKVFLTITSIMAVIYGFPIIQLTNSEFITIISPIIATGVSIFIKFLFRKKEKNHLTDALNQLKYPKISYNSASIGNVSEDVAQEISSFNKIYHPNPFNEDVSNYLLGNRSENYRGHQLLIEETLKVLNDADGNNAEYKRCLILRERTSSAVQLIIKALKEHSKKIYAFCSDGEYPSIKEAILKEITDCDVIKVDESQVNGTFNEVEFLEKMTRKAKAVKSDYEYVLIVLSHVYYRTGFVLNVRAIIERMQKMSKKIIFIIDGAQAVGNIVIEKEILENAHFYVFCGHKWLMSLPNIGIAINNKRLIEKSNLDFEKFMQTDRSFSTYDYQPQTDHRGTIDPFPYISLYMSLSDFNKNKIMNIEEHNTYLSNYFKECLKSNVSSIHPLNNYSRGGLVTIKSTKSKGLNEYLLHNYDNSSGFLLDSDRGLLRFTFHYYMNIAHVNRLVSAIMEYDLRKTRFVL